jgi:hypothetical protein
VQDETQAYQNNCSHQRCYPSKWKEYQLQLSFNSKRLDAFQATSFQHVCHATLPFLDIMPIVPYELEYKNGYTKVNIKIKYIDNITLVFETEYSSLISYSIKINLHLKLENRSSDNNGVEVIKVGLLHLACYRIPLFDTVCSNGNFLSLCVCVCVCVRFYVVNLCPNFIPCSTVVRK